MTYLKLFGSFSFEFISANSTASEAILRTRYV